MKKVHLLCNAHLDPVWLWRKNDGIAEAISTFRVAADLCEAFDGFIFNHNEALLYEWVEEYDPALFCRIQRLVKDNKWIIMGGWYLQPDCVMISGESFLSQIELGRTYFQEKFGVTPTTAINFDSFGHSRGLVQILAKSGYDSYIRMRPRDFAGDFLWEGFDGSQILVHGTSAYNTLKGQALKRIKSYIENNADKETGLVLWGIGNHGGGPSRIDLEAIDDFMKESDVEVIHSTAEQYFRDIPREGLPVVAKSLIPAMVGCYTTMVRIKQANRRLENRIASSEKLLAYAELATGKSIDREDLKKAKKALAFCQFHDILPGTSIKAVEDDSLRCFAYGEELVESLHAKAFFTLCDGQPKANDGEIPIMVLNPHPCEIETEIEVEFTLQNQNWKNGEATMAKVYAEDGTPLPTQNEKPRCSFNLDWIKKVCFRAKLAPSSVNRFNCKLTVEQTGQNSLFMPSDFGQDITVKNDRMCVSVNRETGLLENYTVDGISLLSFGGALEVFTDDEDPWAMRVFSFNNRLGQFRLMSTEEANAFVGYPEEKLGAVRVIEDGAVRTRVQALFAHEHSTAVVTYTIPKNDIYVDVNVKLLSNDPNRMIKLRFDSAVSGTPIGETAFGCEALAADQSEAVYHKWCGLYSPKKSLYILNHGTYGGSFTENSISLSLLRTPVYAAHPINDRPYAPHDRDLEHIDMGERHFSFRLLSTEHPAKEAQIFNETPDASSFFPSGEGQRPKIAVEIKDKDVLLSSIDRQKDGYALRLFNSSDAHKEFSLTFGGETKHISMEKYELQTVLFEEPKEI
jgi:alpha-mannosidase